MDTEALLSELDVSCLAAEPIAAEPVAAEMAGANEEEEKSVSGESHENVKRALKRLHTNLGHPSNKDLVRILKHSKASETAIRLAQDFSCPVCQNHVQPSSALPAKSSRQWTFNDRIGMDVKYLPGWKPNHR